jgi:hypothetical protein
MEDLVKHENVHDKPTTSAEPVGRLVKIGEDMSGTYDQEDIDRMAKEGFVVVSLAWGQGVYRVVEEQL